MRIFSYKKSHLLPTLFGMFFVFFFLSSQAWAATVTHEWAKRFGGVGSDGGFNITLDSSGNIYVTGWITGDVDLNDDGDFIDPYESGTGFGSNDIFISVFTSEGSHLWAKRLGGIGNDSSSSITINSAGNIHITGSVTGNADLNGDGDVTDPYESGMGFGNLDVFISVFTSEGSPLWAKRLGGIDSDNGSKITLDFSGNVYITGQIRNNVDLNGDGDFTDPYESGIGFGSWDAFISVFTSEGSHLWAKRLGGVGLDNSSGITINSAGNIHITGSVTENADLNGDGDVTDPYESGAGFGNNDAFISIFTSEGSHLWAKRLGGVGSDGGSGITMDSAGNIYVTGLVTGDVDLNGDGDFTDPYESGTGFGSNDIFISIFTSEGSHLWAKRLGGVGNDSSSSINLDSSGNIYYRI
ncbi:MAG: SBBP repeat-containing protein [Candidatus Moraniibacteriota bacterium]|nr:MAG: SBBP repeat-containing protein [Candidatus Moranbacteria bacterium]